MALRERTRHKQGGEWGARKRIYRRRRRTGLLALVVLAVLLLLAVVYLAGGFGGANGGGVAAVTDPTVDGAPEPVSEDAAPEKGAADEETTGEEEEAAPPPPADTTMRLSIPRLGVNNALVADGDTGLELGAQHVSGFPWQKGANTYIAGHRVGWPGTGSDHILYNLPLMQQGDEVILTDANGRNYTYRVSEIFAVSPSDVWTLDPIPDRDVVSLQTCTETPNDWWTMGPSLFGGGPESGRLVVRADKA